MRIINQTNKIMMKVDGTALPKKAGIPGLFKIQKPKKTAGKSFSAPKKPQQSTSNVSVQPAAQQVPKHQQQTRVSAPSEPNTGEETPPEATPMLAQPSDLHAEITAFMEPLDQLMSRDLQSFNINDAMALDTQWLEGLEFLGIPASPLITRRKELHISHAQEKSPLEPIGTQNEFRLVCHYCTHMTGFYSVKDPRWNFYTAVNQKFAYRYNPLRYAILAWASLHLSIVEGEETKLDTPTKYHQLALKGLMGEDFSTSEVPLDILLLGAYFLCLYDIMAGQNQLKSILRHVWASLKLGSLLESGTKLSAVSYQIVTWMIYLDVRSALFVGNIQFPNYIDIGIALTQTSADDENEKSDADGDVQYLLKSDLYEKRVVSDIFGNSRSILKSSFGTSYPSSSARIDDSQDRILVVMVKNMLMFATLVRLRNWLSECGNSLEFHPQTLKSKIEELRTETEAISEIAEQDPVSRFHVLVELALVNAVKIYFDRICNPDIRTSAQSQFAAAKIVEIGKLLKNLRKPGTPGSLQWPFPLVIAGIETLDPVSQSWVLNELEDNDEEGWGIGLKKARKVVREVIKRQNEQGRRVELGEVMLEMGDMIII